jgi:hypothetical protein
VTALEIAATWLADRLQLGATAVQTSAVVIGKIQNLLFMLVTLGL